MKFLILSEKRATFCLILLCLTTNLFAKELLAEVKEFIEDELMPSYEGLSTFLKNEYIPNSRDSIGLSGVPDGKAWYEFKARSFTTTNLTPDEIHELGLKEIKRIRKEMEDVIKEVEWDGDFRSFLDFLRTDPQFYYETGEELLAAYRAMAKKIDAYMPTLFNKFLLNSGSDDLTSLTTS